MQSIRPIHRATHSDPLPRQAGHDQHERKAAVCFQRASRAKNMSKAPEVYLSHSRAVKILRILIRRFENLQL
jgi:hypothetical protein